MTIAASDSVSTLGAYLALDQLQYRLKGLGPQTLRALLSAAGSAQALWQKPGHWVHEQVGPGRGKAIADGWDQARGTVCPNRLRETYHKAGITVLTPEDERFPLPLSQIYAPPLLLYVRGNPEALTGKTLAFVGTRRVSRYGTQVTEHLIRQLGGSGVVIVSGLAAGVDGCAHRTALEVGLPTVAVFGCGIDKIFPTRHQRLASEIVADGGALVSEYPMGVPGSKQTFPRRNRVIAGLSYGTVVIEGSEKSGSLITARYALEENRQVFAVPGSIFSPGSAGPHRLIGEGATPLTSGDTLLDELGWRRQAPQVEGHKEDDDEASGTLSPLERRVLSKIEYEPVPMETVMNQSGLGMSELSPVLTMLELNGLITQLPGAKVCRL